MRGMALVCELNEWNEWIEWNEEYEVRGLTGMRCIRFKQLIPSLIDMGRYLSGI